MFCPHVTIIGIGHLTRTIHNATHHPDLQVSQVREMFLYQRYSRPQVEKRAPAAGTRDKLRFAGAYTGSLKNAKGIGVEFGNIDFPRVGYHDPVTETIQQNSSKINPPFNLDILCHVFRITALQHYRNITVSVQQFMEKCSLLSHSVHVAGLEYNDQLFRVFQHG